MQAIPQTETLLEQAQRNHDEILNLIDSDKRESLFLEIGRLLSQCDERQYFKAFGRGSLKQHIQSDFADKMEYSWATRCIHHYLLTKSPNGQSPDVLLRIGKAKMDLLLRRAEAGQVNPELWKMAEDKNVTWEVLRAYLKRYKPLGTSTPIPADRGSKHSQMQDKIVEIGERLGKYAQREYPSYPSKDFRYDVAWKTFEHAIGLTHVFEVCWANEYKGDLPKLWYAYKNMGQPRLFLVVAKEEDKKKAQSLVSSGATAGDMAQNLAIRTVEQIDELHNRLFEAGALRDFVSLFIK
jgi:hypothetical protein